jgi:hypothetical protein
VDRAPTTELEAVRAACCGSLILLLGATLPTVSVGRRFWGRRVLVPLGYRPEPALAEDALRSALGVLPDELLLIDHGGVEVVPGDVFQPVRRAAVRFCLREAPA